MGQLKLNGLAATDDTQLKTTKHDEMMLYLAKKETQEYLIKKYYPDFNTIEKVVFELEKPIKQKGFLIGVVDALMSFKITNALTKRNETRQLAIEIKPTITSIGEVLRQLKIYESYLPHEGALILEHGMIRSVKADILLFTTTEEHHIIFESQGFFYESFMGDKK